MKRLIDYRSGRVYEAKPIGLEAWDLVSSEVPSARLETRSDGLWTLHENGRLRVVAVVPVERSPVAQEAPLSRALGGR